MNYADFETQPDGFPLESDATLGFMQSNYQDAIRALCQIVNGDNSTIITGVEEVGGSVTDGWIWHDGDLIFFQGGTKSTYFIVEEVATQKANSNGTLVDRYFTKVAKFGTGPDQVPYTLLDRINDIRLIMSTLFQVGAAGPFGGWLVLDGLTPTGSPAGSTGIFSGSVMYNGRRFSAPAYGSAVSEGSPIYLTKDGEWTATYNADHLKFSPYTSRRVADVFRRNQAKDGEIVWVDSDINDITDRFDGTGLGKWEWEGWAIANGNNGTTDRTGAISGLIPIVKL